MNFKPTKRLGGYIIKKKTLQNILKIPNTIGIAFALKKPGKANNVRLKVLRVYKRGNVLVGEERRIRGGKAAPSTLQYPPQPANHFRFNFQRKLEEDKFAFGFYQKERFELLFNGKDDLDEVFIGGGQVIFDNTDIVGKTNWFTFSISLRKSVKLLLSKNDLRKNQLQDKQQICLPKANKKSVISINSLEEAAPNSINGRRKVESLILDENGKYVKGIVFSENKTEIPVMFDNDQKITSVLLTEEHTLRKLIIDSDLRPEIENNEEENLGLFPNADHTVPCPPHWPQDRSRDYDGTFENTVADAVLECLGQVA